MEKEPSTKRIALNKFTLTKSAVDALEPAEKSWLAWDDKLVGFGVRVQPTGLKSYFVNYRANGGGRKAPNKRVVLGRHGRISAEQARRMAHRVLGEVAGGGDPAEERTEARAMPVLEQAFEDYMAVNPNRAARTDKDYRTAVRLHLGDWLARPLDAIGRRDVEARFNRLMASHSWARANKVISLLRSIYRRPCVDLEGLLNPVDLWLAAGGRFHRKVRRKISSPAEVLPCWRAGIEAEVKTAMERHAFRFGMYTGMRLNEVLPSALGARGPGTSCLPGRRDQDRRAAGIAHHPATGGSSSGTVGKKAEHLRTAGCSPRPPAARAISRTWSDTTSGSERPVVRSSGTTALRNCFITVAERDLLLPRSLTKRLVNHARSDDITEGYAADWTIGQLREPAQRIADRIEALASAPETDAE